MFIIYLYHVALKCTCVPSEFTAGMREETSISIGRVNLFLGSSPLAKSMCLEILCQVR